jgi:predicted metal-binding protein
VSRPTLSICRRCETASDDEAGEALYRAVKALRRERGLKPVFAVEGVNCLGWCDFACAVELDGKKRSTYTRTHVHPTRDVTALVDAACAYAALEPGQELPERKLPGESAD